MENVKKKSIFDVDLINGPIFKSLVLFAIPLFVSYLFQTLYNTVDTMIVGHVLGDTSLAAIGSTASIFELLVGFANGIGTGLCIVCSRCFGSGDEKQLKKSVCTAIVVGFSSAILISIIGCLTVKPLLTILRTPDEIIDEAYSYIFVITLFTTVMFAYNLGSSLLRSVGDSLMPLIFLIFSSVLNIGLDYWFIAGLNMGIQGAAYATALAQGISAVLCFIYIVKYKKILVPSKEDFKIDKDLYVDMIGQGYSMGFMGSIVSIGSVILQYGINDLGTTVIAAHTAARKVYSMMMLPVMGLALASPVFVGQNAGAGQFKRIRQGLRDMNIFDIVLAAVMTIICVVFGKAIVIGVSGTSDPTIIDYAYRYVCVSAPFFSVLGILIQSRFALQGLGAKVVPLISSIIECVGKIIFCFIFIPMFGYEAVIWCEPLIWVVMMIQLLISLYTHPSIKNA